MDELNKVMAWIPMLSEVGDPILNAREGIIALLREGKAAEELATKKRGEAYRAALVLDSNVRGLWSVEDINLAKSKI